MDEELKKKIEQARQEGYTDDEINAFLAEKGMSISGQPVQAKPPGPIQPTIPTTGGPSGSEAALMGAAALPSFLPEVGTLGAAYGAYKLGQAAQAAGGVGNIYKNVKENLVNKFRPQGSVPGIIGESKVGPIAPSSGQGTKIPVQFPQSQTSSLVDRFGNPIQRPIPTPQTVRPAVSPVSPQPNMTQSVQRMAFDKLKQLGPKAGAALFALTPGELGPKVPQSGPFRGMEINPQTGRPFTEQELAMYR